MSKTPFLLTALFLVGAFVFIIAASFGILPSSFYSAMHTIENRVRLGLGIYATEPYLQKFEGRWALSFVPSEVESQIGNCAHAEGDVVVRNGVLTGTVYSKSPDLSFSVSGSVREDGTLRGSTQTGGRTGKFSGSVAGARGSGVWNDAIDCTGALSLTKKDAIIDPIQGKVVAVQGSVYIKRGTELVLAYPNQVLYVNDEIQVGDGGDARVSLGPKQQQLEIGVGEHYTVKDMGGY